MKFKFADVSRNENLSIVTTHTLRGPWILSNSPSFLNTIGWLNTSLPVVFAHASYIASSDMAALRSTNQYISTTPESEMHYGHGHPYVHLIQDQAALGVDTHFTYSADMVGQARLWLQNLRSLRYEQVLDEFQIPVNNPMSVEQAFYLITRAGGLALRRTDLGIIAPGAKADLVIFDGETPNMLGWADAVAAIVLHSNVGDIEHVLVGGDWVKRDRRLLFDGYDGVKKRFVRSARRIQQIWRETDWPPLDQGLWQNATKYGYTQEIDTLRGDKTGY
jgi:cytosine/adenosine deaminase-related metal-dependent hydrolase